MSDWDQENINCFMSRLVDIETAINKLCHPEVDVIFEVAVGKSDKRLMCCHADKNCDCCAYTAGCDELAYVEKLFSQGPSERVALMRLRRSISNYTGVPWQHVVLKLVPEEES